MQLKDRRQLKITDLIPSRLQLLAVPVEDVALLFNYPFDAFKLHVVVGLHWHQGLAHDLSDEFAGQLAQFLLQVDAFQVPEPSVVLVHLVHCVFQDQVAGILRAFHVLEQVAHSLHSGLKFIVVFFHVVHQAVVFDQESTHIVVQPL